MSPSHVAAASLYSFDSLMRSTYNFSHSSLGNVATPITSRSGRTQLITASRTPPIQASSPDGQAGDLRQDPAGLALDPEVRLDERRPLRHLHHDRAAAA